MENGRYFGKRWVEFKVKGDKYDVWWDGGWDRERKEREDKWFSWRDIKDNSGE